MLIFLVGFMGSGKTTIGKSLSRMLSYKFIDMDDFIQEQTGLSIADIFDKHGEKWFRDKETEILNQLIHEKDTLISTGGGTPCFGDNMGLMKDHGVTFYLQLNPKAFADRVYNPNTKRPLLKGKSKEELMVYAEQMLTKREPFYKSAHYIINAINLRPETIANVIQTHIQNH